MKNPFIFLLLTGALLMSCGAGPEPINFGKDYCSYCKMSIVDPKFGAELVTTKGKVYKFDAMECLIPFMEEQSDQAYAYTLGIAYDAPEKLVAVDSLQFVVSETYNSPMGANVAAFTLDFPLEGEKLKRLDWEGLRQYLSNNDQDL